MAQISCKECGYPLKGDEQKCPECGAPIEARESSTQSISQNADWANYFYECGVIGWNGLKQYATFEGRASRREYWSVVLICNLIFLFTGSIGLIFVIIPWLAAGWRRMHDIEKSGWWSIIPIADIFLALKKSDEGKNNYGYPNPAINLL